MNENSKDLPWVEKIDASNSGVFTLSLHVEYQNEQYARVKAFDQTKLKLPAGLMAAWDSRREKEIKVNKTIADSAYTTRLNECDKKRDKVLTFILGSVRSQKISPTATVAEAATRMARLLKPYTGSQVLAFDEETANIRGLLDDLSTQTADVTTLGLTDALSQLGTLNTEFIQLRSERRVESPDGDLPNSKLVRAESDAAYETVCCYIEAAFLYATTDEDRRAIAGLIKDLNKTTAAYKTTHRMKMAQKKPTDPKEPKQPKDPKEPKQPKDPKEPKQPKEPKEPKKPDGEKPKDPKQPDEGGKKPEKPGGGDGDPDIHLPEE